MAVKEPGMGSAQPCAKVIFLKNIKKILRGSPQPCAKVIIMSTGRLALYMLDPVQSATHIWSFLSAASMCDGLLVTIMVMIVIIKVKDDNFRWWQAFLFQFQGSQIIYAWAMDAESLELPKGVSFLCLTNS